VCAPGRTSNSNSTPRLLRSIDAYRWRKRDKLLGTAVPALVYGVSLPSGNLSFRGMMQVLVDAGINSVDLWTASSKHELLAIANARGIHFGPPSNGPVGAADAADRRAAAMQARKAKASEVAETSARRLRRSVHRATHAGIEPTACASTVRLRIHTSRSHDASKQRKRSLR
jgi:hypothetical protein